MRPADGNGPNIKEDYQIPTRIGERTPADRAPRPPRNTHIPAEPPVLVVRQPPATTGQTFGEAVGAFSSPGLGGVNMNIEDRVARAVETINDGAVQDLRDIVAKVEANRVAKEQVRAAQRALEAYKAAVSGNKPEDAEKAKQALIKQLTTPTEQGGLGLPPDSQEVKVANELPGRNLPPEPEERDKIVSNQANNMSTMLESRAQSLSDLGAKLQIQLTEANNIFQRTLNLQATLNKSNNDTINNIIQKMA